MLTLMTLPEVPRALPDADLVARIRTGDAAALRVVVERYQQRIFALVHGIIRDAHEVEDVAQEVFLKVFTKIDAFDGRSQFYTWLYRVAANAAKDHLKKRSRRPAVAIDEEEQLPGSDRDPLRAAEVAETRRIVRAEIAALPVRYREILTLRELDGLAYARIAEILGISIGTVESRIHRARERLKRRLSSHAD